jgi:hypothetical protein
VSSCRSSDRRRAGVARLALLTLTVAALTPTAVAGATPAAAEAVPGAKRERRLCVDKVTLRDSPLGYAIGHLNKPQRLRVVDDAEEHRWVLVRSRRGLSGWIPRKALCPLPAEH